MFVSVDYKRRVELGLPAHVGIHLGRDGLGAIQQPLRAARRDEVGVSAPEAPSQPEPAAGAGARHRRRGEALLLEHLHSPPQPQVSCAQSQHRSQVLVGELLSRG